MSAIAAQNVSGVGASGQNYLGLLGPSFYLKGTDPTIDYLTISRLVTKFEYIEDEKNVDQLHLTMVNEGLYYTDSSLFVEGLQFQVRWGYPGDFSDMRTATIVKAAADFPQSGIPTIELVAFDLRRNMNRGSAAKNWGKVQSSDIAKAIANKYNFDYDIEFSYDARPQDRIQTVNDTDLHYLMSLASVLNWDCYLDGNVLHFHHKRYEAAPVLSFTYYTDSLGTMLSFRPEVNLNKPPAAGASGVDTATQKPTSKAGKNATQLGFYDISTEQNKKFNASVTGISYENSPLLKPSAETAANVINAHADAVKQRIDMQAVKAAGLFVGTPRLRARSIITLNGVGQLYSGNWRVASVRHTILPQGAVYTCQVGLTRNGLSQGDINAPANNPNNKGTQNQQPVDNSIIVDTQQSGASGITFNASFR